MAEATADLDRWFGHALARAMADAVPESPDAAHGLTPQSSEAAGARLRFHGIAGLLAADAPGMAAHPAWLADLIAGEAQMQRVWEHTHRQVLLPLLDAFAAAGLAPLLLKGTALAYDIYPDPATRARGDTDLLVLPEQVEEARRILSAAGFSRTSQPSRATHEEDWWADSGFGVRHGIDLHWRTSQSAAMEAIVSAAGPLRGVRSLPRLSVAAQAPSLVQTFLHSHINQLAHSANGFVLDGAYLAGSGRLGWVVDNHLMAEAFSVPDWEMLASKCLLVGIAPSVAVSLRQAQAMVGTNVPTEVLEQLDRQTEPSTASLYFDYTLPFTRLKLDLRASKDLRQAMAQARDHILPSRSRIMHLHPDYPDWPLALLQIRRMGRMALRTISRRGRPA